MEFRWHDFTTVEGLEKLLSEYEALGPLPGILLPMMESFLPILPLFVFVVTNAAAFGLYEGFFYSWIGSSIGSIIVFYIVRLLRNRRFFTFFTKYDWVQQMNRWVEEKGFGPLFLLHSFPFTPSSIVNVVAGLSNISIVQYSLAVFSGKMVMIFIMSFIGYDVLSFFQKPLKSLIVILVTIVFWWAGKKVEKYLAIPNKNSKNLLKRKNS